MPSIMQRTNHFFHRVAQYWAIPVWLFVWEIISRLVGQEILLVSPIRVVDTFFHFLWQPIFGQSICYSGLRILFGFFLSMMLGVGLGAIAAKYKLVRELLFPLLAVIKVVPVASFIILALVWFSSKNLSILISFLIGFPVFYTSVDSGLASVNTELLEMADVFRIPFLRRLRSIYLPAMYPSFGSAASVAIGLCWKSGIAAEVIGIPQGSIGEKLYRAKIYLETPELFAWTLAIVLAAVIFDKVFALILRLGRKRLGV